MNGWILVPITLALMAIAVIVARSIRTKERVRLEKPKAPEPTATVDEGTVARIGMASDKWGARVHIILEEKPGKPISLAIDTDESAFPLTQVGDHVRIERQDEEGEFYEFTNLTLGLTVNES